MITRLSYLVVTLALAACTAAPTSPQTNGVTFLHINDTYRVGAVEDGRRGGFARVTTIARQIRAEGREVRLLHGGDFLYPSIESQLWDGEQMVDAFNYLDALAPLTVVPGNHEFDRRTPDAVAAAMQRSEFEWVGANLDIDTGEPRLDSTLKDHVILAVGGMRIGVFGLTLVPADGGNARDYLDYSGSYEAVARRSLESLSAAGVDLIAGLTHLHMTDDVSLAGLKREFPKFAFIVGGHEHEPEYLPAGPGNAEVMKGASNARVIWRIDVDADEAGRPRLATRMLEMDDEVKPDSGYQAAVANKWRARLLERFPFLPARIGEAAVRFDAREATIRNEESNWGNFIADRMLTAFGEPAADLAFVNSGSLRIDDYIAHDITFEDVARTFGFSSHLRHVTMNGAEFRRTLEAGYRGEGPSKGYFPQVAGFRICIDRSRPDGGRIVQLQVPENGTWQAIGADKEYLVVAPEYLVGGGDGYEFPAHREASRPASELRYLVLDAILAATAEGRAVGEPVDPDDPRIAFAEPGSACFAER